MAPWLLIPVKSMSAGKSRLMPFLENGTRRQLNELFVYRALETAGTFPGREHTAFVSECDEVIALVEAYGVLAIRQTAGPGLNAAAMQGVAELRRRSLRPVLLMPCDEPMVRPADLRRIAAIGTTRGGIVICPDKHGTGTNAMFIPQDAQMQFHFGEGSLLRHCREARRIGFPPTVHYNPRIAFDIDAPQDLMSWTGRLPVLDGANPLNFCPQF
jgi:2-phospho-L-lactate guanylyltransferase